MEKNAHWTKDFICSNCGCKCYPVDIDFGDYNYCPNCGAKMVEEPEKWVNLAEYLIPIMDEEEGD